MELKTRALSITRVLTCLTKVDKGIFSIVLLALVNGEYEFMYADVGTQGRISDGGIYKNSSLYNGTESNSVNYPRPKPLNGRQLDVSYFIVGDEAFALTKSLMKHYSGDHRKNSKERIFNYRLSRARRIVENVFGIM